MIRLELKKILTDSRILLATGILVLLTLLFSICTIYLPLEKGYSPADVAGAARDMERSQADTAQKQADYLTDKISEMAAQFRTGTVPEGEVRTATKMLALYSALKDEVEAVRTYPEFLESIASEAKRMEGAGLLFRPDTFSSRNIAAIAERYAALSAAPTKWIPSDGIALLTEHPILDAAILFLLTLAALSLTVSERRAGIHTLVSTIPSGCRKSWFAKLCSLWLLTLGAMALFYFPCYLLSRFALGWGEGTQLLQSTVLYLRCPYEMTISQFLWFFFAGKGLALLVSVTVIYCIVCFFDTTLSAICGLALLLFCQFLPWHFVNRSSQLGILKECNLPALLHTSHYFSDATHINFLGYPQPAERIGILVLLVFLMISIFLSRFFWQRQTEVNKTTFSFPLPRRKSSWSTRLFPLESKKFLLLNKGFFLFFVMSLLFLLTLGLKPGISQEQYFYLQYAHSLRGELTEEKAAYLAQEEAHMKEAAEKLAALSEQLAAGELNLATYTSLCRQWEIPAARQKALKVVKEQYEKLSVLQAKGESVRFFDESGWQLLSTDWGSAMDLIGALWMAAVLILCIFNFGVMETETGIDILLRTCPNGNRNVYQAKRKCVHILAISLAVVSSIVKLLRISQTFPLEGILQLSIPISSITVLEEPLQHLPIFLWCLLLFGSVAAETWLMAECLLIASICAKSPLLSLFFCTLLPVANFLLSTAGIRPLLFGRQTASAALAILGICALVTLILRLSITKPRSCCPCGIRRGPESRS